MVDPHSLLSWTPWRPLMGISRDPEIPGAPGLYGIRRVGRDDLDYIGQTSRSLRQRLGMLQGAYLDEMPYRDPHTAAPAPWALRHATRCEFEVSVAQVEGSTPWRKGVEAVAIARYRYEHERSPTIQFGRMPIGYRRSSMSNARAVDAGKRFKGGPNDALHASHEPGIAPLGRCDGNPQGSQWGSHQWTAWMPLPELSVAAKDRGSGLYRLRGVDPGSLLYIGQGLIPARLLAHLAKTRMPNDAQGSLFIAQSLLECSWVINDAWQPHQRLELENDLIAAHVLETGTIPAAQFLG